MYSHNNLLTRNGNLENSSLIDYTSQTISWHSFPLNNPQSLTLKTWEVLTDIRVHDLYKPYLRLLLPLYTHNRRNIIPTSSLNLPYTTLRRFLGTQTMWYLHSHTVCDKLFFIITSFWFIASFLAFQMQYTGGGYFYKYLSIAFVILTLIASGLAQELTQ